MMKSMSFAWRLAGGWLAIALVAGASGEEADDLGSTRCLSMSRVTSTEIIDPQTILFHTIGDDSYVNRLRGRCPGLRRNETLMFDLRGTQVCDMDTVAVVQNWGGGFTRGASCRLGRFVPVTDDDVEALRSPPRAIEPREVPGAEPEEIGSTDEDDREQR